VAIVVAGLWAFYVFAYENRIKPSFTNPQVEFNATMTKGAEQNGLPAFIGSHDNNSDFSNVISRISTM
jgi:hypothetical protein